MNFFGRAARRKAKSNTTQVCKDGLEQTARLVEQCPLDR